eukprot:SAG11_NODE_31388_length_292_cov_0.803109_2_plen_35_part_01
MYRYVGLGCGAIIEANKFANYRISKYRKIRRYSAV